MMKPTVAPRALVLVRSLLVLATTASVSACAPLRLPVENSGPARSREGIELAVTRQACTQNEDPDFPHAALVEERVELQMRNATSVPVTVQRDAFRLITPEGYALRPMTWRAADPMTLGGGEARTFELRYMTEGGLACDREMRLEADGGVRLGGGAVAVQAVRFRPRAAM